MTISPAVTRRMKWVLFGRQWTTWWATLHVWEEGELIATAVSRANLAWRCVAGHRLRAVTGLSEAEVEQALDPTERTSLTPVRRALLEFAEELTLAPDVMSPEAVGRAIDAGASVDRLRDVVEVAAMTNIANRITIIGTTSRKVGSGGHS